MSLQGLDLFKLLPAVYRTQDAQLAPLTAAEAVQFNALQALPPPLSPDQQTKLEQLTAKSHGPLQSLLLLVQEQMQILANDLDQLYDDQFIETCAAWVVPYIGDLIGYQTVNGVASSAANQRAEVAHTISYRRRKGTVLALEQLAHDATGWGAHAVEFFKLLADTQYMNHLRLHNHYAPDLRRWEPGAYMNTGFDATAHKVDVRRIAVERGCYNIQNIGIFLWSLNAYSLTMSPATPSCHPACFRFSPLGADMPLFNSPPVEASDITALATPANVPDRLRRRVLCRDIQSGAGVYYAAGQSLALYLGGGFVPPNELRVCDLSGEDGQWANLPVPETYRAAIDPHLGRIALSPQLAEVSPPPQVVASFHYGFNGDMGGGEYSRTDSFTAAPEQPVVQVPSEGYPTIQSALASLNGDGVVEIADSGSYSLARLTISVKNNGHIEFRAADRHRPTLILSDSIMVTGGQGSICDLNGFLIAYAPGAGRPPLPGPLISVQNGGNQLTQLRVTHCTLVPGLALTPRGEPAYRQQPALVAETAGLQVTVQKSILGGMRISQAATASVSDSIVDATEMTGVAYASCDGAGSGGALTLTGCTVVGRIHAALLTLVSNSIIWAQAPQPDSSPSQVNAALVVDRQQQGCVRFSYLPVLPAGAILPRCFQCVPKNLAGGTPNPGSPQPIFVSLRYGDPGYCKLFASTNDAVRRGADDGGEMGAFHFVLAPLRENDLRTRMQEYLPAGLEYGIFYET